jgi:hypothetical protein
MIKLHCKLKNERKGFQGIAEELIPVSWGDRRYLIASDEMIRFCNHVNSREEPRSSVHGFHLLRDGDEEKEIAGRPDIPEEYKKYLLKKPIQGEIIAVGKHTDYEKEEDWKVRDVAVTINIGKEVGLLNGMELYVTAPKDLVESIIITKVGEQTSEATMRQMGSTLVDPQPGWKLSTVPRWADNDDI